jgi:Ion channel
LQIPCDIISLGIAFLFTTLICSIIYYYATPYGWGIQAAFEASNTKTSTVVESSPAPIGFFDCVYFSVVTIATLGYGDYRPVSCGRIIATLEVIVGIVLMGVLISRLVSRQQERLTKRLVGGQMNREIQDFRKMLSNLLAEYGKISVFFPMEVNIETIKLQDKRIEDLLNKTEGLVKSLARYWRHESLQPDLADVVPIRAAGRMLGQLVMTLDKIACLLVGKTPISIGEQNRISVKNITESCLAIADILERNIDDEGARHSSEKTYDLIRRLRSQFKLKKTRIKRKN